MGNTDVLLGCIVDVEGVEGRERRKRFVEQLQITNEERQVA